MIILSADNRSIPAGTPYNYLADNNATGQSSLTLVNSSDFTAGNLILVGLFGNTTAEIFQIGAVNDATQTITLLDPSTQLATTTQFAHPESTKITILPYNQVRFFWTAATGTIADETPTFDMNNALTGYLPIDPTSWFTSYEDSTHSTGFGWFIFRNSFSGDASQNSNAIPYAGFSNNSVQQVFQDFQSLLNTKELRLVTQDDMFSWINEGIFTIRNKLNLSNPEYTVSTLQSLSIVPGTQEYMLPADFSDLVNIVNTDDTTALNPQIDGLSIRDAMHYQGSLTKYYIRNRYIGFVPQPLQAANFYYRYRSKGSRVTGLDDLVDLPDNGFYIIKDWMMWRACLKFQNPNAQTYYKSFSDGLNGMIASSIKRDAMLDSWGIAPWANK